MLLALQRPIVHSKQQKLTVRQLALTRGVQNPTTSNLRVMRDPEEPLISGEEQQNQCVFG
jgi:hypothetical protein